MIRALLVATSLSAALGAGLPTPDPLPPPSFQLISREAFLMGTRAHLQAHAPTREAGLATLEHALRVLEATERELSTWRDDSAISALNRHPIGAAWQAPDTTCRMLRGVFAWQAETGGAFDPALAAGLSSFAFDEHRCTVTRRADAAIDVGGFGKGEALDRVEAALGPGPWLVDLGGQVSAGGPRADGEPWTVDVAEPVRREQPYMQVRLRNASLATSGNSERGDHIIDPHSGRPAAFRGSVTVWHRNGLAADALSTALYVMGPDDGARWAEARGIAALYLIPEDTRIRAVPTQAWTRFHQAR